MAYILWDFGTYFPIVDIVSQFFYHSLWHHGGEKRNGKWITKQFREAQRNLATKADFLSSYPKAILFACLRIDALNLESQNCTNEIYINFNICCEYSVIPIFVLYFCCCHGLTVGMSVRRACRQFTYSPSSLPSHLHWVYMEMDASAVAIFSPLKQGAN